ncbi:probable S-adenosylmethionine carrier 2, chloroplastic isoform X2 [Cajanus cajan]|uniref:probable S-adenosylmethionine carrier 2, chloroplastic isoform X2 n=1 Tax=Cajanus cajan TaxID=3821 RepID=UPI00098D9C20|nr:probable S-adenosylmethionine carrier 2, chloroplastic isoform X2 [Cajanus cajan]
MSGCNKSSKNNQQSIKYWRIQHGGASSKADLSCVDYSPSLSNNENKQCYGSSQPKSPRILSTAQLISAIGQIWDSASRPLSVLLPKENVNLDDKGFPKDKILGSIDEKKNELVYTSSDTNYHPVTGGGAQIVQEQWEFTKVRQKMLLLESSKESQDYIHSLFQRRSQASDNNTNKDRKEMEHEREEMSCKSGNVYWWIGRNFTKMLNCQVNVTQPENLETNSPVSGGGISIDTSTPALANESDMCSSNSITHKTQSLSDAVMQSRIVSSLCSDYFLQAVPDTMADIGACHTLSSSICADYHINSLASCDSASDQCQHEIDDNESLEIQRRHVLDITDDEPKVQTFLATHLKPCNSQAKQKHAFSGALAGICVSLCLHPVDTIKTVIQSCRAEHRSIFYIGKSIVSDRGLLGLYRGITTNIACSAPISAVYTVSYESVKVALLPYLPKEYYSFAHCVGGGCASIATSFIFTPSERIKQQMQVGSHYRNCWDVLIGIIRNGGLSSLYAGWRAVLCRNVPHSIIKFYTYESLKQVMPYSTQPNTFQTLVCGGLAGSTAALFTTPFDVIKTRLQTQIPGSENQYDSVLHALYKISKSEGLKGLYRGLTPRLIMYMSQGSLFFASYEFFKRAFSLEASPD